MEEGEREGEGLLNLAVNMLIHPEYEQWIFEFLIEYPTTLSYVFKDKGREKSAIFTKFSYIWLDNNDSRSRRVTFSILYT